MIKIGSYVEYAPDSRPSHRVPYRGVVMHKHPFWVGAWEIRTNDLAVSTTYEHEINLKLLNGLDRVLDQIL